MSLSKPNLFPPLTTLSDTQLITIYDANTGDGYKMTVADFKTAIGAVGGGGGKLDTPGNPSYVVISATQINLDWDVVANATSYTVERSTDSAFNTGLTLLYTGALTAFNDTTVDSTIQNYYRIKATATGFTNSDYATVTNSTFDPESLTNQAAIYKADTGDVTVSSTLVTQWADKTGGGFHMNPTGSQRPTYMTSGGPNGKNFIRMTSGNVLQVSPGPINTSPFSFYAVIRINTFVDGNMLLMWGAANGNNGVNIDVPNRVIKQYTGVTPFGGPISSPGYRLSWMLLKVVVENSKLQVLCTNDEPELLFEYDGFETGPVVNGSAMNQLKLQFTGDVAELRGFTRKLTSTEDQNLKSHLVSKYAIQIPNKVMIALGDSHTEGTMTGTPTGSSYMKKLVTDTSMQVYNFALGGTVTKNYNGTTQTLGKNLVDLYVKYNLSKFNNFWLHFSYGTNDDFINGASVPTGWKADYKSYIQSFISAGFAPSKIIIGTPPYTTSPSAGGAAGLLNFVTPIREIASELGTQLLDNYATMLAAGLDCYTVPGGDGIHGNATIHNHIYTNMIAITGS